MTLFKKTILTAMCAVISTVLCGSIYAQTTDIFKDVSADAWYADDVNTAYTLGLVAGTDSNLFSPEDSITLSQAVTMASRANAAHSGKEINPDSSDKWYTPYVDYALEAGIVLEGEFDDFDKTASRAETALIFSRCLPYDSFKKFNDITDVPDVDKSSKYYEGILSLYNAGVLTGSDEYGNFRPKDSISRAEATAILNRTVLTENRIKFSPEKYSWDEAYILCYQEMGMNGHKEGISSGWQYDNRGGYPKTSYNLDYNSLVDISKTNGVAMIREFNNTDTGSLFLETTVSIMPEAFNGFCLEYRNASDSAVYRLFTKNNAFMLETDNGVVTLTGDVHGQDSFALYITVDLDNNKSHTVIGRTDCGTHGLCTSGKETNIQNLRLCTTDEDTPVVNLTNVHIVANYGFYDKFENCKDGLIPYGWQGEKATNKNATLDIGAGGYAQRSFKPVSGIAIANTEFNLTQGQSIEFILLSDNKTVGRFSTDEGAFYFGNKPVYEDYVHNMWYRLRVEADTLRDTAKIWVNGRTVATLPLEASVSYIDSILIKNTSDSSVSFDVINVFEKIEHEDYVPEPISPKGDEDYLIGLNICSLWKNGEHYGWACISAYDDREPVLGYYDEGNPETADWEIKYMVEHGIDFQAFCWYADQKNAPMKKMHLSPHLYDGYMYAKYSDKMDYCIIWEAANAATPKDLEAWNNYYVPYFIENFFKDDRYLVIDNKPLLCVFGANDLRNDVGSSEIVKQMFDSLEKAVQEQLGFDGVIFTCNGSANSTFDAMGFDGVHAYGWGSTGYSVEVNKKNNLNSASYTGMHTVPTISVGFNSIPWHNIRYPIMTAEDYKTAHEWVRDEYLPKYAEKGTWEENFLMLSTWNEYGEGTYIMPAYGNCEFGYLDALREVYTDEKADESLNLIPTEAQKRRINRLYPQHFRILRKAGYSTDDPSSENLDTEFTVDYSTKTNDLVYSSLKDVSFTSNGMYAVCNGDGIVRRDNISINSDYCQYVSVTVEAKKGTKVEVFFITDLDSSWTQDKSGSFIVLENGMNTHYVNMGVNGKWNGNITAIRVDVGHIVPGTGTPELDGFTLKKLEFCHYEIPSKYLIINDQRFEMQLPYTITSTGDVRIPFDPKVGMDLRLGMYMYWDYLTKSLTLDNGRHNAVYTIGKNTFIHDGVEKKLGYTLTAFDGLPLLSVEQLCEAFEYDCSLDENDEVKIYTHEFVYFDKLNSTKEGCFEFNTTGDNEGWMSSNMKLFTFDGYLSASTTTQTADPIMNNSNDFDLDASKFTKLTIRVRFKYDSSSNSFAAMYFSTDKDTNLDESKCIRLYFDTTNTGGEWKVYSFDLTKLDTWKDTIKNLRFDPFNTTGQMDIDYIRFE